MICHVFTVLGAFPLTLKFCKLKVRIDNTPNGNKSKPCSDKLGRVGPSKY